MLLAGQFISQIGDKLAWVAFPWLVHAKTGSTLATGAVFALYTLPYLFFGAAGGVLVDRFDRRRLMITMDIVRAVIAVLVPLAVAWWLPSIYVMSFAIATAGVLFEPAKLAILPEIVPERSLLRANSFLATTENMVEILGWALGGVLVTALGTTVAFRLDAVSFAASAVCIALVRYRAPARAAAEHAARAFGHELREGLSFLRHHRGLLINTLMAIAAAAGIGATAPLTFFLAIQVFGGTARDFGWLEASMGIGYLAGSLALAAFATRVRKGRAIIAGLTVMGLCLGAVSVTWAVWAVCIPYAVFGAANAAVLIAVDTYLQQVVPERLRGRVIGARFTLTQGTFALSVLAAGALAAVVDVRILYAIAGVIIVSSALAGALSRDIREA